LLNSQVLYRTVQIMCFYSAAPKSKSAIPFHLLPTLPLARHASRQPNVNQQPNPTPTTLYEPFNSWHRHILSLAILGGQENGGEDNNGTLEEFEE
jgi:hypothetical protein